MLDCHACLRSYLRALLSAPQLTNVSRLPRRTIWSTQLSRSFQTETATTVSDPQPVISNPPSSRPYRSKAADEKTPHASSPDDGSPPPTWSQAVGVKSTDLAKDITKARRLSPKDRDPEGKRLKESYLKTELKYLKDPVKLSDHIAHVLQSDDDEKALALCRLSGRAIANTVSWNHLINWQMRNGRTTAAFSTFNEMKMRAQLPDSHTYVLLLRGLADYAHHPNSLGRALSLYHAMKGPRSKFPPNIIHVNAVLKVCARANDMDSLWDIASRLPERGPHSADAYTFTTIINFLRATVLAEIKNDPSSEVSLRRVEEVVVKGKQLWGVIAARWREGELLLDEKTVCAMGRLLLTGNRPRDWDNVFSLVQQTMNITRLEPRLGTVAREQSGAPKIRAPHTPADLKDDPGQITLDMAEDSEDSMFESINVGATPDGRNASAKKQISQGRGLFKIVKPDKSMLSLILEACLKTFLKNSARGYWDLLTDPNGSFRVQPDTDNVNMLLRNLRRAAASTEAMELIEDLPRLNVRPTGQTYWLAMTSCKKDVENPAALENARRILDSMQRTLPVPNIISIHVYVVMALQTKDPETVIAALQRFWPSVLNLRSGLSYGVAGEVHHSQKKDKYRDEAGKDDEATDMNATFRKEALILFRAVIEAYNFVLKLHSRQELDLGSLKITFNSRVASLRAYVGKFTPRATRGEQFRTWRQKKKGVEPTKMQIRKREIE